MEYREFGKTGLKVSLPGFGAGHIGSPDLDEHSVSRLLNTLPELGINLIDTARSYGASESRIGRHLFHRRHEFIYSTKVGYTYRDKPDWSFDATMGTIDEALVTLRTDYLDIVHLHSCDLDYLQQGDAILALEKARIQGKIRVAAYSGENEALSHAVSSGAFGSLQFSVNIFDQQSIGQILPVTKVNGMGVIAKRPLANAVWRYASRPEGHGHAVYWDRYQEIKFNVPGFTPAELALRFVAFTPGVDTLIAGSSGIAHLKENLAIIRQGPLSPEVYDLLRSEFLKHGQQWRGLI